MNKQAIIIGVGNIYFGDDGYGSKLANILESCSKGIKIIDAGIDTLGLIGMLFSYDVIIFLDVCKREFFDDNENTSILKLDKSMIDSIKLDDMIREIIDPHVTPPLYISALLYSSGEFNGDIYLICMRPGKIGFGEPLSSQVIEATPLFLEKLRGLLKELELPFTYDIKCIMDKLSVIT